MNISKTAMLVFVAVSLLPGCARFNSVSMTHPLGTSATMVDRPFQNTRGTLTAVVYVENPPVVLDDSKTAFSELNPRYTFFNWFYDSFAIFGKGINLVVHSMIAEEARQLGISTASVIYGNTFLAKKGSYIEHMSFDEAEMPKLIGVAARVGATHIIKGRWISGRRWTEQVTRRTEHQGLQIGNLFFFPYAVTTITESISFSSAKIECTVYEVVRGQRLFAREFEFYDEEILGGGQGFRRVGKINRSLVESILNEIEVQARQKEVPQTENASTVRAYRSEAVIFSKNERNRFEGDYIVYPTLTSVERSGQVLKFTVSFANPTEAAMTISFARDSTGLSTLARNSTGEKFQASGSSESRDRIEIRAGERKSFYFSVPTRGSTFGAVNFGEIPGTQY